MNEKWDEQNTWVDKDEGGLLITSGDWVQLKI